MRCDHEYDDGPYVLGALAPSERAAYERHLATCSFCREAVGEIAMMPGLLSRLDPADFANLLDPEPMRERPMLPDLVSAAQVVRHRERRGRRWRTVAAVLAAACLAVVAGVGGLWWGGHLGPTAEASSAPMVAMEPVAGPVPISAEVGLTSTAWGTKVTMKCSYARNAPSGGPYTFHLVAYGPDDAKEQISSWIAGPGADLELTGMTSFSERELARIEVERYDGKVVLAYEPR